MEPVYKRIQVIINPAAGQDRPILGTLNRIFQPAGVDWDVSITKKAGDGRRLAQAAVAAGVDAVAVYGGDGTVTEVASGLAGTGVPLAVLPGGTANVMSVELGIPSDLAEATALVCGEASVLRTVDMGQVGEHYFLLRVGIGVEAEMVAGANRESKDRFGWLAYVVSALQALRAPQIVRYRLTMDGQDFVSEGLTCVIANAGNMGLPGLSIAPTIDISDGLLDVVIIRQADLALLLSLAASMVTGVEKSQSLEHWQAREVTVVAEPPQSVQVDGEMLNPTPVNARIIPQAVQIIIPRPTAVPAAEAVLVSTPAVGTP